MAGVKERTELYHTPRLGFHGLLQDEYYPFTFLRDAILFSSSLKHFWHVYAVIKTVNPTNTKL
jgi:hypothetical protein